MISISWPSSTDLIIDAIRDAIGRDVIFNIVASSYECPNCNLDPATDTSDNAFCATCSGEYYIDILSGVTTQAVISWGPSDKPGWESGGQLLGGDCTIQIDLSDEVRDMLDKTVNVVVDERVMEVRKTVFRGVQSLNRVLLSLIEKDKED